MHAFLMTIHVAACLLLILVVLLQAGRGAGFAVFGGGGDQMFNSPSGSSFLKNATITLASTFAVTSLMLTLLSSRVGMSSVTQKDLKVPVAPAQSGAALPPGQPSTPAPAQPAGK
jgi:preprotein translocase subunit SecG